MIRRLFWLVLGAVLGVTGYRKATALARSLRPVPRASALTGFAADVREGMALYMERQAQGPASTLEGHRRRGLPSGRNATQGPARRPLALGWPRPRHPAQDHGKPAHGKPAHDNDESKDGR